MPRKKPNPPARTRSKRLIVGYLLIGACLGIALIAGYLLYLDHLITSTFDGRRWSVPARVYAQSLELYPGLAIESDEIEVELKRLGYRRGR
jgi:penicillin-binding protein 1B